jgi:dUTP pyrophosphatase
MEIMETFDVYMFNQRGFKAVRDDMRKTKGDIVLPTRATEKAMAYDFYSNDDYTVSPNETVKIWTDIKAYMGLNECLILNVRSSMGGKFMLANTQGWIDGDYYGNPTNDGNIGIFLKNISNEELIIHKGDRIAQGAFFNFLTADNDNVTAERKGGFGSTGV